MSISKRTISLLSLTPLLLGCAHGNSESYADAVLNRPMPPDDDARIHECAWKAGNAGRCHRTGAGAAADRPSPGR